jgi:hypothetical protein
MTGMWPADMCSKLSVMVSLIEVRDRSLPVSLWLLRK